MNILQVVIIMIDKINNEVKNMSISKIRQYNEIANKYPGVLKLTIGEPHFKTPVSIKDNCIDAINNDYTKYAHPQGDEQARKFIQEYIRSKFNLEYELDEILVTVGSSGGLATVFKTLLNPGDEIIIPSPAYTAYVPLVKLCGAVPILVNTEDSAFQITSELLENHLSTKTKAVLINYPHNPTGVGLSKRNQEGVVSFIKDNNLFLISDEVYNTITYDDEFTSMGIYSEIKDQLIIVNSFSKSHSMTGWRIGYTLASKDITNSLVVVNQNLVTSVSTFTQHALKDISRYDLEEVVSYYQENMEIAYKVFTELGFDVIKPNGAFYLFINVGKTGLNSDEFFYDLLLKLNIAVIPGRCFGDEFDSYIRISYCIERPKLIEALYKIKMSYC